jgi:hypothetical protein
MKLQKKLFAAAALLSVLLSTGALSQDKKAAAGAADAYVGRWDLTLKAPDKLYPSWLEVTQENGQIKARLVSRWGHARMLPKAELTKDGIMFVSPKEEEDRKDDMVFQGKLEGKKLVGTTTGQDGTPWQWTGERAPSLKSKGAPKWGKPIPLFDGKDMAHWKMSDPKGTAWKIENGTLVSPGRGSDIVTTGSFEDFKLHLEFNCAKGSNSGVYLRGRYEVQIENDPEPEGLNMRTGSVYGFIAPTPEAPRTPGVWQTYDIAFVGRMITVVLNGKTVIDHQEIPGITGGALDSHEGQPGPIYLQGSEDGHVAYRNIVITPAK